MTVGPHGRPLPAAHLEGRLGQRREFFPLLGPERARPAARLAGELRRVDLGHLLGQRGVELAEREEAPVAQRGDRAPGDEPHAGLDVGLVLGPAHPRGRNRAAVVLGQVGIRPVQDGVLAPCAPYHGRLAVVGHQLVGDAAVEVERVHVRGQSALGVYAEEPLGVELAREGQARHEHVYVDGLAGVAVGKGHFGSRPVGFHLLAGLAVDAHGGHRDAAHSA